MPTVDWSTLKHAYGPATDIPALLTRARLAPAPHTFQDEPWFSLWSALCHQGDVYTGSYAATPALVAIAEDRADETRVALECLYLAAMIELERVTSYSLSPPPAIPEDLQPAYNEALRRGAALAARLRPEDLEPDRRAALTASAATFRGAYAEARAVVDPPEEDEEAG
jgi:hypothetical protein